MDHELFERLVLALERLAPAPPAPVDPAAPAYVWHGDALHVARFAPLPLALLTGIDAQRDAVVENGRRLAKGHSAHDILLWGVRGGGKSALVKSSVAALQGEGLDLALVEVGASDLDKLPAVFSILEHWKRPAIVFVDDLAFEGGADAARSLRSILEGGASGRPPHMRLYVTSNRRHIVARDMAEQDSAINVRDVVDDRLALADRFGLSLGFHACDQDTYLAMVLRYAEAFGLPFDQGDALTWSTQRGARSGRVAWHYTVELAGRAGKAL
jgi:predicted AAA+ superfamily ATPase